MFFSRDESWLKFDFRVLEEAQDDGQSFVGACQVSGDYGEQP